MKIFRNIGSFIFFLLIIINLNSVHLMRVNWQFNDIAENSVTKMSILDSNSQFNSLNSDVGKELTDGKTTLTIDKASYKPGELFTINVESTTDEMNGSLEWQLESPISEIAFDFSSELQDIFEDPHFKDSSIPDWINESFDLVQGNSGYLNLTENPDIDVSNAEVFFNTTNLKPGKYLVSFDYFSKGQNLLLNPSFEGGNTTGWYFNNSLVNLSGSDPTNASDGNYYLSINGTEGLLLNQNVTISGNRFITFSARATGITDDNYWDLALQAYNESDSQIGSIQYSSNSRGLNPDQKGYVLNKIVNWETPINTSYVQAIFNGRDNGADGNYTGLVDDFHLAEVPPALQFSYWDTNPALPTWTVISLTPGTYEWENASFTIETGQNFTKTFRFLLPDDNSFSNNVTAYWLIDNIAVNLVTTPEDIIGQPITNVKYDKLGGLNSTWIHSGTRENLSSTFDIHVDDPENATAPSHCEATITVQLPKYNLYFGSWIFVFLIHPIDSSLDPLLTKAINISFTIEDKMNYVIQDVFMLRGSTNVTEGNTSVFTEYFEQETNIEYISPGDNLTVLGFLESNSTLGKYYDLDLLQTGLMSSPLLEIRWESNWPSRENISWSEFGFISYNIDGKTILDGNFSSPLSNSSTLGLNFKIPIRGIYGDLSANLTFSLTGTNTKPNGEGGDSLSITIPLDLPTVKFQINVTEENIPAANYYLSEYFNGNVSIQFLNFISNLSTIYPSRNITSTISIPMTDIYTTAFLDNVDSSEIEVSQVLPTHFIGNTILWLDKVDPHRIPGTYKFLIRWETPFKQNILEDSYLNITDHSIIIQGTLSIPSKTYEIFQGESKTINFSVLLTETEKKIGGLNLIGVHKKDIVDNQTYGDLSVYEEEGVYKIDLFAEYSSQANYTYTIEIFISGRDPAIGEVSYKVISSSISETEVPNPFNNVVEIGSIILFLLAGIAIILVMYRLNKSI
ncbi:MAG: hypothetical protein ACXAC8_09910 [Candidatus Hodarchaeales archaeon]|jgi:hypothetical protein